MSSSTFHRASEGGEQTGRHSVDEWRILKLQCSLVLDGEEGESNGRHHSLKGKR
jgi:hypothetical protein